MSQDEGLGRSWAQGRTHPLAERSLPFLQMILCGLAHRLWVWTMGPRPQPQAAGQGSSSQDCNLFILLHGPNFLLSTEKGPQQRFVPKLAQSGPLPWVPRHPGRPGQDGGRRPRSAWPAGRVEAEPKIMLPCGLCSLPETTGETHTEASQPLLSGPSMAPQGLLVPISLA